MLVNMLLVMLVVKAYMKQDVKSMHDLNLGLKGIKDYRLYIVSWEPEWCYHCSMMFCWEPERGYHCTKSMVIVPFWFETEHRWTELMTSWFVILSWRYCLAQVHNYCHQDSNRDLKESPQKWMPMVSPTQPWQLQEYENIDRSPTSAVVFQLFPKPVNLPQKMVRSVTG